jgi:hypothetical protein
MVERCRRGVELHLARAGIVSSEELADLSGTKKHHPRCVIDPNV